MKQILIVCGIALVVMGFIYGSLIPYLKAESYLVALSNLSRVRSMQEFAQNFDTMFNFYSPVGDEEVTKFLATDIVNLVNQAQQPEGVSRDLTAYIEPRLQKDNPRQLLAGAQLHTILWMRYHTKEDFSKAEGYYKQILSFGPNLPPALYGLLDLYERAGDKTDALKVGNTILSYWPDDTAVKALIQK